MHNVVSIPDVVVDAEPHLFEIWGAKDVGDYLLVDPASDGTKSDLLDSRQGPCIVFPKDPAVTLHYV